MCSPPMKGAGSHDALWEAVKNGTIDTVATDHCPFMSYEKDWGKDNFTKIPNGCAGVENLYPYMLSAANEGKITFNRAVELCSDQSGENFRLYAKRLPDGRVRTRISSSMTRKKISRFRSPICIRTTTIRYGKGRGSRLPRTDVCARQTRLRQRRISSATAGISANFIKREAEVKIDS